MKPGRLSHFGFDREGAFSPDVARFRKQWRPGAFTVRGASTRVITVYVLQQLGCAPSMYLTLGRITQLKSKPLENRRDGDRDC